MKKLWVSSFIVFIVLLCTAHAPALAEDKPEYAAKNIPAALLPNANYVVRRHWQSVHIFSRRDVAVKEHYVITVLNEKGDDEANHAEYSSSLTSIESISGCIYDANGDVVEKLKKSDFKDVPASMRAGEFSDAKFRWYQVHYRQYPYTVEYNIETRNNNTFHLPVWHPQPGKDGAVEYAEFVVTVPDTMNLKYKQFHISDSPVITRNDGKKINWTIRNVLATRDEPLRYNGEYTMPTVMLALDKFMLDDYEGSTASWSDFGAFVYQLNKGRDNLPDDVKAAIQKMVAGVSTDREKIRILYHYLQKTMRYVSIQYGIGGWQTLDADFLSRNQYGDCKALSNYMMAILQVAGITSFPVLISAGRDARHELNADFVCSQFNHCILCVPQGRDTVWLECTSTDLPSNFLGDFTQNRQALMITPSGGVLVHTPVYDTTVNFVTHHASVILQDGKLLVDMANIYSGDDADDLNRTLLRSNDHDRDEYLQSKFHLPAYKLNEYKYHNIESAPFSCMREDVKLTASNMFTKTGDRSFVMMDIAPVHITTPADDEERKEPFHFAVSNATIDTIELTIPAQTEVEFVPASVTERYPFGSFSFAINKEPGKLVLLRNFTINAGSYDPALYKSYVKFTATINKQSRQKVVFKDKK